MSCWKEAINLIYTSSKGRMCVAEKDIKRGSVILIEFPIAYAPHNDCSPEEKATHNSISYSYSNIEKSMMNAAYKATGERFKVRLSFFCNDPIDMVLN